MTQRISFVSDTGERPVAPEYLTMPAVRSEAYTEGAAWMVTYKAGTLQVTNSDVVTCSQFVTLPCSMGYINFDWPTIAGKRRPRRDIPRDASLAHAAAVAHCHSYRVLRLGALGGATWYERRA